MITQHSIKQHTFLQGIPMKRLLLVSAMMSALPVYAGSSGVNLGPSMTTGPSSNSYLITAAANNPAMNSLIMDKDEALRFSYLTVGANVEYGQVDSFIDDLEELTDILDDPSLANEDSVQDTIDRFNGVLEKFGEEGYLKTNAGIHMPLAPLFFKSEYFGGTFSADFKAELQGGFSVLDDTFGFDQQNGTFATATSLYLKSGVSAEFSLGYSRPLKKTESGTLYGGIKARLIHMELSKQVIPLTSLDGDEIEDVIADNYDNNLVESDEITADLGLVWDASWYRLGLVLNNITSPEFEYGNVGENCGAIADVTAKDSCLIAKYFSDQKGEIVANEVHTMDANARVDMLVRLTDRLQLSATADVAEYNDIIGDEHQWVHVAATYDADLFFIPSIRVGYQKNLTGTETSSLNLGASLFSMLKLDLQYGLDTIEEDGSDIPRTLGLSLSIHESF